jgi:AcrR family transcriptional regulator
LQVMAERGAGALTYRSVAEQAGVSLGVTSYHFGSRRELLAAAFALHLDLVGRRGLAFETRFGPAFQAGALSAQSVADRLVDFLDAMIREERASVVASHELSLELTRDAGLAARVDATLAAHRHSVTSLVARISAASPEEDAAIVSAVMDDLALSWIARPDDPHHRERARRILRRLVETLFAARSENVPDRG